MGRLKAVKKKQALLAVLGRITDLRREIRQIKLMTNRGKICLMSGDFFIRSMAGCSQSIVLVLRTLRSGKAANSEVRLGAGSA